MYRLASTRQRKKKCPAEGWGGQLQHLATKTFTHERRRQATQANKIYHTPVHPPHIFRRSVLQHQYSQSAMDYILQHACKVLRWKKVTPEHTHTPAAATEAHKNRSHNTI